MEGQYSFRLHFRLHNQESPDAEDYIVRSHENYFINRSVSVELPDMPTGKYVVYLKVTGERDSSLKSVEEVVKRECSERVENEKLAQVGYAYDLAHSKAWDDIDKEKRHANREVAKKQTEKNEEKKQQRRDVWEAAQHVREKAEKEAQAKAEAEAKAVEEKTAEAKASDDDISPEKKKSEVESKAEDTKTEEKSSEKSASKDNETPSVVDKERGSEENSKQQGTEDSEKLDPKNVDESNASVSTSSPMATPKSQDSSIDVSTEKKQENKQAVSRPAYDSAGDSSDSPVEDWEELYSSDDMTRKPHITPRQAPTHRDDYDTEEEKMPDPWNAIGIIGIRVYSKDEKLELRTVMEGGELLEGGMGKKGAADLDNAEENAGGVRAKGKGGSETANMEVKSPLILR
ncbi:hypothetical protein BKA56DRAFT_637552 [Ilyonectria sp. MPI-CAGE-AT-0026]|nr:hypothetical protein BKA56DRAFT_637552 [Ilyonectria sp. MPI-CAGE-AT-0026]